MLLFGWSCYATLLLSALVTIAVALILYAVAAPRFGRVLSGFAAIAFVASSIVQPGTAELMLDNVIALLCLLSLLSYRGYLDTGRMIYSFSFGLLAAVGLLIKGNAGCLALLPVFAILIGGNWKLALRWSYWLPALIVAVVAGPWYILTYAQISPGFRYHWGSEFVFVAVPSNAHIMIAAFGPLLFALGVAGFIAVLWRPRPSPANNLNVAAAALLAAVMTFQSIVPAAIQDRYLAPAMPPLTLLAAYAIWLGVTRWFGARRELSFAVVALLLCVSALPWVRDVPPKLRFGIIDAAKQVWAQRKSDNPSVLIVMDGAPEAAAIAELAMNDPARPSLFAVRGSRLLGGGGYNNQDYSPRFESPRDVMAAIDSYAIPLVLLRNVTGQNKWRHIDQVEQARARQPDRWELLYRTGPANATIDLYRIRGNADLKADVDRLTALSAPHGLADKEYKTEK